MSRDKVFMLIMVKDWMRRVCMPLAFFLNRGIIYKLKNSKNIAPSKLRARSMIQGGVKRL